MHNTDLSYAGRCFSSAMDTTFFFFYLSQTFVHNCLFIGLINLQLEIKNVDLQVSGYDGLLQCPDDPGVCWRPEHTSTVSSQPTTVTTSTTTVTTHSKKHKTTNTYQAGTLVVFIIFFKYF